MKIIIVIKSIFVVLLLSLFLFFVPSCGGKTKVVFLPEGALYDCYEMTDGFNFHVNYIYKGQFPNIELISVVDNGEIVECKSFENIDAEEFSAVNGFKFGIVSAVISCTKDVEISEVRLSVDGSEESVVFSCPLVARKKSGNEFPDYDGLTGSGIPFIVPCNGTTFDNIPFGFIALDDIRIVDIDFTRLVQVDESEVVINNVPMGSLSDSFPLDLKKEDTIQVIIKKGTFAYKYGEINISPLVRYCLISNQDNELLYYDSTHFQQISSQSSYSDAIDYFKSIGLIKEN